MDVEWQRCMGICTLPYPYEKTEDNSVFFTQELDVTYLIR